MVTTMRGTSLSNKLSTFRSNVILVLITSRTYGTLTRSLRRTGRPWTPPCKRNARKRMSAVNSLQKRTESLWTAFQRKNKLYSQTNGNSSELRSKRCSRNCSPFRKIIDDNSSSRFFSLLLKLLRRLKVIWSCARSNERSNSEKCSVITLFRWSWYEGSNVNLDRRESWGLIGKSKVRLRLYDRQFMVRKELKLSRS